MSAPSRSPSPSTTARSRSRSPSTASTAARLSTLADKVAQTQAQFDQLRSRLSEEGGSSGGGIEYSPALGNFVARLKGKNELHRSWEEAQAKHDARKGTDRTSADAEATKCCTEDTFGMTADEFDKLNEDGVKCYADDEDTVKRFKEALSGRKDGDCVKEDVVRENEE